MPDDRLTNPCPDCTPSGPPLRMSTADYLRALERIDDRKDFTPDQVRQARAYIEKHKAAEGQGIERSGSPL